MRKLISLMNLEGYRSNRATLYALLTIFFVSLSLPTFALSQSFSAVSTSVRGQLSVTGKQSSNSGNFLLSLRGRHGFPLTALNLQLLPLRETGSSSEWTPYQGAILSSSNTRKLPTFSRVAGAYHQERQVLRLWFFERRDRAFFAQIHLTTGVISDLHFARRSSRIRCAHTGTTEKWSHWSYPALTPRMSRAPRTMSVGFDIAQTAVNHLGEELYSYPEQLLTAAGQVFLRDLGVSLVGGYQHVIQDRLGQSYGQERSVLTLLKRVRSFHRDSEAPSPVDHVHLFVGHSLVGLTVGAAYRATYCRLPEYSVSLSSLQSPLRDWIVLAHELGHALGAEHLTSNTPSIMNSVVQPLAKGFASPSQAQIMEHLDDTSSSCREFPSFDTARNGYARIQSDRHRRKKRTRSVELFLRKPECGTGPSTVIARYRAVAGGKGEKGWRTAASLPEWSSKSIYLFRRQARANHKSKTEVQLVGECNGSSSVLRQEVLPRLHPSAVRRLFRRMFKSYTGRQ